MTAWEVVTKLHASPTAQKIVRDCRQQKPRTLIKMCAYCCIQTDSHTSLNCKNSVNFSNFEKNGPLFYSFDEDLSNNDLYFLFTWPEAELIQISVVT